MKRIGFGKDEKKLVEKNLKTMATSINYMKKNPCSIYFFESLDMESVYNNYHKKILEEIFAKYNINYDKLIMCHSELVEAIREFRVDVVVTPEKHKVSEKEILLKTTKELSERRLKSRIDAKKYKGTNTLEEIADFSRAFIDCIPDYTQVVYVRENDLKLKNSEKVQFINNFYELAAAVETAKINIKKRIDDIYKSYSYIPKTGNPTFDKEFKKYWLASKFEENEYEKELQKLSRFDFVMFRNRYNLDEPMYCYEPFKVTYTFNDIKKMVYKTIEQFQKMGIKKGEVVGMCLPNSV